MTMLFASGSMRRISQLAMAGVLGLTLALVGCDSSEPDPFEGTPDGNIVAVLTGLSSIQNTGQAVVEADLDDALAGAGPYTVFAPLDQNTGSFLSRGTLLRTNVELLPKALRHHVVARSITQADLVDGATFETIEGSTLRVQVRDDGRTYINDMAIRRFDVPADNGVVHLIEGIMLDHFRLEERLSVQANLSSLLTSLNQAGFLDSEGGDAPLENAGEITVFAPTNAAFSQYRRLVRQTAQGPVLDSVRIAQQFLPYHVVPGRYCAGVTSLQGCQQIEAGAVYETLSDLPLQIRAGAEGGLMANNTPIVTTNIRVAEGVVHLIGDILTKPLTVSELITIRPDLNSLETMLRNGALFGTVGSLEGITLLAPNDAAVQALPSGGLPLLTGTSPDAALLQKLLSYHVLPQVYCTSANRYLGECTPIPAPSNFTAPTLLEGSSVTEVTFTRAQPEQGAPPPPPSVNGQRFVVSDIETRNGIVHIIEGVMDEQLNLFDQVKINGLTELRNRLNALGLNELLSDESQDLTLFAPNNSAWLRNIVEGVDLGGLGTAFTALSAGQREEILRYHVVPERLCLGVQPEDVANCEVINQQGASLPTVQGTPLNVDFDALNGFTIRDMAKNTPIASSNISATNGVLHIVPTAQAPPDVIPVGHLPRYHPLGIEFWARLDNATATQAVRTAMNQGGPYTVFAFGTGAFRERRTTGWNPYGTPQHPRLLCYHVVEGEYRAADLQDGQTLTTMTATVPGSNNPDCQPETLTVQVQNGTVTISGTASSGQVIDADLIGSNGIVHFVDNILRFPNPN